MWLLKANTVDCYPHPYWMRLWSNGFSHGLKNMPPACFLNGLSNPDTTKRKKEDCPSGQSSFLVTVDNNDTVSQGFKWFHPKMKP